MDINRLHEVLNDKNVTSDSKYENLTSFLKYYVLQEAIDIQQRKKVAYTIASLLATDYARSLNDNQAIEQILLTAGELEIQDVGDQDWSHFQDMINRL